MSKQFVLHGSSHDRATSIHYEADLNAEQLDAVLNGDGACLVLAGAGSGKTRTITYRVAYLIERGVQPSEILLLTFTNKAAREMLERVERLLGSSVDGIWGGTFHSIANRLLRSYADRLGYERNFTILDADDAKGVMTLVLKSMKIDTKARRFPSSAVCLNIISYTRNVCGTIRETLELKYPHFVELESELSDIASRYEERKRTNQSMDFDDLLTNVHALMKDPDFGRRISSLFRYVLVDEYQDTNAIQADLVRLLSLVHGNIFVVGDDAQSIYAFRGADVQNILNFPHTREQTRVFQLLSNYRSTPEILALANATLKQNVDQFQKELIGHRDAGDRPALIPCASARQEAQYVAEQILALRQEGTALGNIAVLFRATSHSQQLELELLKRDIPYEYRGGLKLFERAHIKDVLSYLRIHQNVRDETAWMRLLLMQPGIGAQTAEKIVSIIQTCDTIDRALEADIRLGAKAGSGWLAFTKFVRALKEHATHPSSMIRSIAASSYQEHLEREYPNWRDRLEDIEQFALFSEGYDDLESFLADVSLYDDVLARKGHGSSSEEERMILSTIHQAKGLEWDHIFLIHLADGFFPNRRAMAEAGGMEEERRLFYVAVTRARRGLFLSYPLTVGADTLVLYRPSQFLDEVDTRLFERIELIHAGFGGTSNTSDDSWSWDGDSFEPTIEIDPDGNRISKPVTPTVWKNSKRTK